MSRLSPGQLAQIACTLEVSAKKPGNVHRFRDFNDASYVDFLLSASAIAEPLNRARNTGVGQAILEAVEATRRVVASNTNLGIILLLAPLAAVAPEEDLRSGVRRVLDSLTVADAQLAYQAIRLARPGGLGSSQQQDIANEPTVSLLEAMRLAADRDLIARQYATGYADIFDHVLPALGFTLDEGRSLEESIIHAFLTCLSHRPDTLILRKCGPEIAAEASRRASQALFTGDRESLDLWLCSDGHTRNPGATADIICAGLYVALADGTIDAIDFASS